MKTSIRNRLLLFLLTVVTAAWLLNAITSYFDFSHQLQKLLDAQMVQSAKHILSITHHEVEEKRSPGAIRNIFAYGKSKEDFNHEERSYDKSKHSIAYQVWILPDKLIARSPYAPQKMLSDIKQGFSEQMIDNHLWRIYSVHDKDESILVQMGECYDERRGVINAIALKMMIPLLALLLTLALVVWYGIGHAMKPLDRLADQVSSRSPDNLHPVSSDNIPEEVAPLVTSMNSLFVRLNSAFENERQFTSNAAHELRTPLTGLKTQAQVALNAKEESVSKQALARLIQGVDLSSHLVTQMLTLARLDPEADQLDKEELLLSKLLSQSLEEIAPMALEKEIDFTLVKNEDLSIKGDANSLAILIRNLADNAVRYTPKGGRIEISLEKEGKYALLRFNDNGPGIPESAYEKVFERFYRHGGSTVPGSGLGLSIVGRIAELHGAKIDLSRSTFGGLQVTVLIPVSS